MKKLFHLTQAGIDELQTELDALKVRRVETAEAIRVARELGDLAENAEYQSARQEQERNDGRIDEIEHILANVEVIKSNGKKQVGLGSTVTLQGGKKDMVLQVVGTIEADPLAKKISDESPIGKALMGKKEGDDVEIKTPSDTTVYKIAAIA
ncbi:MAG TPA: transcription elongation factor GreA [Candidatus Saccharimonadales bacterium]|nr:transcription elongation factor GreA [Candidatus Saccharimonadales bacterium]